MTNIKDGGPIHPCAFMDDIGEPYNHFGLSLRDWFAGQALAQIIADGFVDYEKAGWEQRISSSAFLIADAMLAARETKP